MALAVAMEMEEKRKREAAERGEDSDEGEGGAEGDDEGVVYSLDEITASMQKKREGEKSFNCYTNNNEK